MNSEIIKVFYLRSGLIFIFILLLNGCIAPFDAKIEEEFELLSIEGSVVKGEDEQVLIISRTSSLNNPAFKPVLDCEVALIDNLDNRFFYSEKAKGSYILSISDDQLVFNRQYKLQITTPSGQVYESEYETLVSGVAVDTIYYEMEEKYDKIVDKDLYGVQFYVDIKATDSISKYYRWKLEETYEINSIAPITFYYTGDASSPVAFPNWEKEVYHCWKTEDIRSLFLSNTVNLMHNQKKNIPLNYVSTETDRLRIKYSLLVNQYTLSEGAYNYFQKAKNETRDAGGLYSRQPGKSISNIYNVNDSNEIVLGYFWLSHCTKQRIFVPGISSVGITGSACVLVEYQSLLHGNGPFPRYVYTDPLSELNMTSTQACFNCTYRGGVTSKPDFWE